MHGLAGAPGVDDVDLAGDLVPRAQPRRGGQREDVVGVVVDEGPGVCDGELLEGVPEPVVGAGGREVVAGRGTRGPLLCDDLLEDLGDAVDDVVLERPAEHDDPGAVRERVGDLGAHRPRRVVVGHGVTQRVGVVQQHPLRDLGGVRVVALVGCGVDHLEEVLEVTVLGPQVAGPGGGRCPGGHRDAPRCGGLVAGSVSSLRVPVAVGNGQSPQEDLSCGCRVAGSHGRDRRGWRDGPSQPPGPRRRRAGRRVRGDWSTGCSTGDPG